jgi:hypothetical protein
LSKQKLWTLPPQKYRNALFFITLRSFYISSPADALSPDILFPEAIVQDLSDRPMATTAGH